MSSVTLTAPVFCSTTKRTMTEVEVKPCVHNLEEGQTCLSLRRARSDTSLDKIKDEEDDDLPLKSPSPWPPEYLELNTKSLPDLLVSNVDELSDDEDEADILRAARKPKLIATNVDEIDSEYCCSCGCEDIIDNAIDEDDGEEAEKAESEDEGCYTMPQSNEPLYSQARKTHKNATTIFIDNGMERRSFSFSVDSGRSSHSATSTTSSKSSTRSTKLATLSSSNESVRIVPQSPSPSEHNDALMEATRDKSNKVAIFVPFSAISEVRRRRESSQSKRNRPTIGKQTCEADNVVICDTKKVILRINNAQPINVTSDDEQVEDAKNEGNADFESGEMDRDVNQKPISKRMARKMTTTLAVYEMVNSEGDDDDDNEQKREDKSQQEHSLPQQQQQQQTPHRKKDLCKLLGLIEYDVSTDATSPEDVKLAQKLALDNLLSALQREREEQARQLKQKEEVVTTTPRKGVKKDLAKFLGVEEEHQQLANNGEPTTFHSQNQHKGGKKSLLVNWGQVMKNSMKWRPQSDLSQDEEGKNSYTHLGIDDDELLVDDENELKRAEEVIFPAAPRTNKKDLNKYLGLDDSDSEEMVFIQNKKAKSPSFNSDSVNVVGIKIVSAENEDVTDEIIEVSSDGDESITGALNYSSFDSSTWDSNKKRSSLNKFFARKRDHSYNVQYHQNRSRSSTSDHLPRSRKSVVFKEYDFNVEDSIATGTPVIPKSSLSSSGSSSSNSRVVLRKKKKDAERRAAEVRLEQDLHHHHHQHNRYVHRQRQPGQIHSATCGLNFDDFESDSWLMHNIDPSHFIERPPPRQGRKVQRGAMVLGRQGVILQQPDKNSSNYSVDMQNYQRFHRPPQHQHQHRPMIHLVSWSPKGRVRLVKRPQAASNIDEYRRAMKKT